MKKNILIILTIVMSFFISKNDVLAYEHISFPKSDLQQIYTGKVSFSKYSNTQIIISGASTISSSLLAISLDGNRAVCIDPGTPSKTGLVYIRGPELGDSFMEDVLKVGFEMGNCTSNIGFIKDINNAYKAMAQAYTWTWSAGVKRPMEATEEALISYFKSVNDLTFQEDSSFLRRFYTNCFDEAWARKNTKKYYYWYSPCDDGAPDGNPKFQRFVSDYKGKIYNENIDKLKEETCKICVGSNCTNTCPDPTVTVASCGGTTVYDDPYDWKCIAGVEKYKYENTNATATNNNICTVYCKETATTDFPADNYNFDSGRYFGIGSSSISPTWGPISIRGIRDCRSFYKDGSTYKEGVSYTNANSSYISANNTVQSTWNTYIKRKAQVEGTRTYQANGCQRVIDGTTYKGTPTYEKQTCLVYYSNKKTCKTWSPLTQNGISCPTSGAAGVRETGDDVNCTKLEYEYATRTYSNYVYNGSNGRVSYCPTGFPDGEDQYDSYALQLSTYNNAVTSRNQIIEAINFCTAGNINYNFSPKVEVNYPGDSGYSYSGSLTTKGGGTVTGQLSGNGTTKSDYKEYTCEVNGNYNNCTATQNRTFVNLVNNTQNRTTIVNSADYYHDTDLQYINKVNGKLTSSNSNGQFINLGFGAVPIIATRNPSSYPISLTYTNVGNIVNGKAHFNESYVQYINGSNPSTYSCTYKVNNDLVAKECLFSNQPSYCTKPGEDAKGIDVIYRTIDLTEPFPGRSGKKRNTGSNWCSNSDCSYNNSVVQNVITNNRGVTENAVYSKEPIYSITLTPSIIKQIRNYNKGVNNDYGDFNLSCIDGKKCISSFIHQSSFNSLFSGSCSAATTNQFDSCR